MTRIPLHDSMKVANKVLKALNALGLDAEVAHRVRLEPYNNGREQGWAFIVDSPDNLNQTTFVVAQYRKSDEIVVYTGIRGEQFSHGTNVPSHRAYYQKVTFPEAATTKAAKHLKQHITRAAGTLKAPEIAEQDSTLDAYRIWLFNMTLDKPTSEEKKELDGLWVILTNMRAKLSA